MGDFFSKYYVWGGVGINYFICGFSFLWVNVAKTIVNAMWNGEWQKTQLNMDEMVCYNFDFTDLPKSLKSQCNQDQEI